MSDINPILTQIAKTNGQTPQALQGSSGGVFAGAKGLNFWDFILAGLTGEGQDQQKIGQSGNQNSADAKLTENTQNIQDQTPLGLLKLALQQQSENPELAKELKNLDIERIQLRVDKMQKIIDHLTNGLPAQGDNGQGVEHLLTRLETRIEKLMARIEELKAETPMSEGKVLPLLIAMGLSPSEITEMQDRINQAEEKLGRDLTVDDLIAGVANIIPPQQSQNQIVPNVANNVIKPQAAKNNAHANGSAPGSSNSAPVDSLPANAQPTDELAARLNNLVVGGDEDGQMNSALPKEYQGNPALTGKGAQGQIQNQTHGQALQAAQSAGAQANNAAPDTQAQNSFITFLQNTFGMGDINTTQSWYQSFFEGIDFSSFDIQSGLPLSQAAQAAHMTTAMQQAGQPHQASQMVAAHLQKAAKDGMPRQMTLQLNPPELGRVDIRLEFSKDKTMKAHMVVEKPETFLMLQRDASVLERALQGTGLETDSGSLSFELAEDNSAFDHNNNGGGGDNAFGGSGGSDTAEGEEIIQTTMTWNVDPDTGHVHYDILA